MEDDHQQTTKSTTKTQRHEVLIIFKMKKCGFLPKAATGVGGAAAPPYRFQPKVIVLAMLMHFS